MVSFSYSFVLFLVHGRDFGLLFFRAVFGVIMMVHGFPKLKNLKETSLNFANMGFRPGAFWGTLAALLESLGGIALTFGFMAIPLAGLFVLEFLTIVIWKISKHMPFAGGWEFDLLLCSAPLMLFLFGAGMTSLDHVLFWL